MNFPTGAVARLLIYAAVGLVLVSSLTGYGINACQHHRLARQSAAVLTRQATTTKADAQAQHAADSALHFQQGQQHELQRQLDENSHHAESLPPVLLPAKPPHGE